MGNSPGPVNCPYKGPVTQKMFPFDDVIMSICTNLQTIAQINSFYKNCDVLKNTLILACSANILFRGVNMNMKLCMKCVKMSGEMAVGDRNRHYIIARAIMHSILPVPCSFTVVVTVVGLETIEIFQSDFQTFV